MSSVGRRVLILCRAPVRTQPRSHAVEVAAASSLAVPRLQDGRGRTANTPHFFETETFPQKRFSDHPVASNGPQGGLGGSRVLALQAEDRTAWRTIGQVQADRQVCLVHEVAHVLCATRREHVLPRVRRGRASLARGWRLAGVHSTCKPIVRAPAGRVSSAWMRVAVPAGRRGLSRTRAHAIVVPAVHDAEQCRALVVASLHLHQACTPGVRHSRRAAAAGDRKGASRLQLY